MLKAQFNSRAWHSLKSTAELSMWLQERSGFTKVST